jgi:hypothetical protein
LEIKNTAASFFGKHFHLSTKQLGSVPEPVQSPSPLLAFCRIKAGTMILEMKMELLPSFL